MTHAKITRMTAVIGYAYFKMKRFMSLRPHDRRHAVGAIEDRRAGQIRAEHQLELPGRRWQPVLLMPGRSLMLEIKIERSIGLRTMYPTTSVTVSDQKASVGGSCPAGKCKTYSWPPTSVRPAPSLVVVQYAASSTTLTTGNAFAQAARTRIPLPGWPHLRMLLQPLTVVVIALAAAFMMRIAVRNASVAPMMTPCTTPEPETHASTLATFRRLALF